MLTSINNYAVEQSRIVEIVTTLKNKRDQLKIAIN